MYTRSACTPLYIITIYFVRPYIPKSEREGYAINYIDFAVCRSFTAAAITAVYTLLCTAASRMGRTSVENVFIVRRRAAAFTYMSITRQRAHPDTETNLFSMDSAGRPSSLHDNRPTRRVKSKVASSLLGIPAVHIQMV